MITITNPGVNHCTCMMCATQFFFDKEDILQGENFPYIICPKCGHATMTRYGGHYYYVLPELKIE